MTYMRWALFAAAAACCAGFGLNTSTDEYTIDTGAELVFSVRRTAPPVDVTVGSIGGITSLKYKDVEYAAEGRYSTVNDGFDFLFAGVSDVTVDAVVADTKTIKVTVVTPFLTHYYIAQDGDPRIYMGTIWTKQPDIESKIHFVFRLNPVLLPEFMLTEGGGGDTRGATGTIEADDVFALSHGETRSKHYTGSRLQDWIFMGASGAGAGMWLIRGSHETGSGGPFYRSARSQTTDESHDLIYAVNDIHAQTEAFRSGTLAAYSFAATAGDTPNTGVDYEFYAGLGVSGFVIAEERGQIRGVGVQQRNPAFRYTVAFANANGQYWSAVDAGSGAFRVPYVLPGVYTMTVYKNELAVFLRENVTVEPLEITSIPALNITGDPSTAAAVFRIGDWDGSPRELMNGGNIDTMHPSDSRLSAWDTSPFVVGEDPAAGFPAYLFKDVNGLFIIEFVLPEAMKTATRTIRVGTTLSAGGGRPAVSVNGGVAAVSAGVAFDMPTRSVTLGTYRGVNEMHVFEVPPGSWTADAVQTVTISVEGGAGGFAWLSPALAVDCVDLLGQWETSAPATDAPATAAPPTVGPTLAPPASTLLPNPPPESASTTCSVLLTILGAAFVIFVGV